MTRPPRLRANMGIFYARSHPSFEEGTIGLPCIGASCSPQLPPFDMIARKSVGGVLSFETGGFGIASHDVFACRPGNRYSRQILSCTNGSHADFRGAQFH